MSVQICAPQDHLVILWLFDNTGWVVSVGQHTPWSAVSFRMCRRDIGR